MMAWPPRPAHDPLAVVLELGLAAVIVAAPLPFGSVGPAGRLVLEVAACVLAVVWGVRAVRHGSGLPPAVAQLGLAGALTLAALQLVPVGQPLLGLLSPAAGPIRGQSIPRGEALRGERELLGTAPVELDPRPTLSLAPEATASALRTGVALVALLLVSASVARARGLRLLAAALLLSAAFQGLYGTLVLTSGHDRIWHVPKVHYLDSATGTFVNRNHYASLLAASLPAALALVLHRARRGAAAGASRIVTLLGREAVTTALLGLMVLLGTMGLLLSLSRAGTALGLAGLVAVAVQSGRGRLRGRLVAVVLGLALAALPLAQLGAERLGQRYARAGADLAHEGGRATVWRDTVRMAASFPVVGSGLGSFSAVYPLFRSPGVRLRYDHAHNDLLQLTAEAGIAGLLCLGLVVLAVARRLVPALAGDDGLLPLGFAAGLAVVSLHALVDFPFHIPATAAVACVLAGGVLGASAGPAMEDLPSPRPVALS